MTRNQPESPETVQHLRMEQTIGETPPSISDVRDQVSAKSPETVQCLTMEQTIGETPPSPSDVRDKESVKLPETRQNLRMEQGYWAGYSLKG